MDQSHVIIVTEQHIYATENREENGNSQMGHQKFTENNWVAAQYHRTKKQKTKEERITKRITKNLIEIKMQ